MDIYESIVLNNTKKYYTDGTQNISDDAFDALVEKIRINNPNSDVLTTGWGYKVESKDKFKHLYGHVGSLTKVRTWDEINHEFSCNKNYIELDVSAKLDGMSVVLYYTNGTLVNAVTRGDGEFGVDITEKVIYLIGNRIQDKNFTGAVRGEILMCPRDFELFKEKHPEAKNHRNSAVGLINGDELNSDYDYLTLYVYSVIGCEYNYVSKFFNISCVNRWLGMNFNHIAPRSTVKISEVDFYKQLDILNKAWSNYLNTDGVVLTDPYKMTYNKGELSQTSVAFKFQEEIKISKILHIEWNMSKNSCLIPVAVIEPVELAGTTVKRVTAFNAKFIKDNHLGEGAIVAVCKRGEIIPSIREVIKEATFTDLPERCPYCNDILVWDSVHLVCANNNCSQKEKESIKSWCMNLAPIDGFGWKTINKIINDIYYRDKEISIETLTTNLPSIPGVTYGHGEQGCFNQMLDILQNGKFTVSQFLLALNIPGLGKICASAFENSSNAKELLDNIFNNTIDVEVLYNVIKDRTVVKLLTEDYLDYFKMCYNLVKDRIKYNSNSIRGKVVITGTLSIKRADFERKLKNAGWILSSSVTSDTMYLITNEKDSTSTKSKKAKELGITIISETEFLNNVI